MNQDADSWAVWLEKYGPAMLLLVRQWVPDRANAEDIVQESFLRFWKSRARANDPAAYLFACVKRCTFEWLRRRGRRLRREEAVARHDFEPDSQLLSASLEHEERRTAIESAMRQLPDDQREVLVLKIWG